MSEKPRELELIEGFYSFADKVATLINTEIVAALGEDADWEHHAGRDEIPQCFSKNFSPERFKRLSDLWTLRESASGYSCDLSEYDPAEWAKELSKTSTTEKPLNAYDIKEIALYVASLKVGVGIPYVSEGKTWETDADVQRNLAAHYAEHCFRAQESSERLYAEVQSLKEQILEYEATREQQRELMIEAANNHRAAQSRVDSLTRDIKELQDKFTCFKADAVTSLKAIDLCILATLPTENQSLTHRARNFRMKHIHQIILNEVASLSDRKLITYEDDY
ncbi:hypothetical protein [Pseudanabaena sp. BC1403]|uniref:hypothetical protein n=1 Tax=Pseudanabaena sp. BC1403 TaxID=2043171 RepID=UPI000CD9E29C|nr:hypothetical protein [Pseudanabaena sp. BC1403]